MGTSSNQPHAVFRSFGPAFIKAIFTERFMARTLSAVIKPHLVTPDNPCEVIFEVPLRLDLTLSLLGFDPYQGTAQLCPC